MSLPRQSLRAGCKINLSLRITGVRDDGYHTLDSLFWPLDEPHDVLHCAPSATRGVTTLCETPGIDPERNTLVHAYERFAEAADFAPPLRIVLEKGIPHGAGLGGGSSDAAALLRWLNAHAPRTLDMRALTEIAGRVGADVPFFLHNVPARVRGTGEDVTPCDASFLHGMRMVLACPAIHISTAWAYAAWDSAYGENFALRHLTTPEGKAKDIFSRLGQMVNDFEGPVFAAYPALREVKEAMLRHGATAAVLSGSGASLAGLFRDASHAHQAAEALRLQGMRVYESELGRMRAEN